METTFGRLRDIGGLPDVLKSLAGEEGLNRAFRDQGLPITLLDTPDVAVPMRDIVSLYHRAATITGIRSFGLSANSELDVGQHGLMGEYVMQARDLLQALYRFRAALPYYESGSSLVIETAGHELRVGYVNIHQDVIGYRHAGDFVLCILAEVISGYLGNDLSPIRIETCYRKGPWEQDLEDFFGAPVEFGKAGVAIVLDRGSLGTDKQLSAFRTGKLVSFNDIGHLGEGLPHDFPHSVAKIIELRLHDQATDLEGTALSLDLGPRTVQRRLSEYGLSYRDLVLHCRMRRASRLLAGSDATIRQIGREVGYESTPAFIRAFKAYFGTTPNKMR